MNIRPYMDVLRKQGGWVKQYDSRAGGARVVELTRQVNTYRRLRLQLWDDGHHRVTFSWRGRECTGPSGFTTPPGMLVAIEIEGSRAPPAVIW